MLAKNSFLAKKKINLEDKGLIIIRHLDNGLCLISEFFGKHIPFLAYKPSIPENFLCSQQTLSLTCLLS